MKAKPKETKIDEEKLRPKSMKQIKKLSKKLIDHFIEKRKLEEGIRTRNIPVYDRHNENESVSFKLIQCLLKNATVIKNISEYKMGDVEWKLNKGDKDIIISTRELRRALLGEKKLIIEIYDEKEISRKSMYIDSENEESEDSNNDESDNSDDESTEKKRK